MKIIDVTPIKVHVIETDSTDEFYNQYTRYGADIWFVRMGESDESFYNCEEIEALFQEYIKNNMEETDCSFCEERRQTGCDYCCYCGNNLNKN